MVARPPEPWVAAERRTFNGAAWGPAAGEPSVVAKGTDDAVLLYSYGRLPFGKAGLAVTGDREVAARFKEFGPGP